jgi:hypothetical protein
MMNTATEHNKTIGRVMAISLLLATLLALLLSAAPANAAVTPDEAFARDHNSSGIAGNGSERKQLLNVVYCPTGGSDVLCVGTGGADALIGRDSTYDWMRAGEGNDTYDGKGGCDALQDASPKSSDRYLVSVQNFCNTGISWLSIQDDGGNKDAMDLSSHYRSSDFVVSKGYTNLYLDGPGVNDISVDNFFTIDGGARDSIETFKFSDKTLTARQVRDMIV